MFKVNNKDTSTTLNVLVSLLLTLNTFGTYLTSLLLTSSRSMPAGMLYIMIIYTRSLHCQTFWYTCCVGRTIKKNHTERCKWVKRKLIKGRIKQKNMNIFARSENVLGGYKKVLRVTFFIKDLMLCFKNRRVRNH